MRPHPAILLSLVFAAACTLYALTAAPVPFFTKAEAREALVVQSMAEGHGWLLPTRDGHIASKPPFFHWMATFVVRTGVLPEELAIRLPSVAAGAAGVAVTAAVGARWAGPAAGVLAASVLASSREWIHAATQSRVDMTLTFALLGAVLAWFIAVDRDSRHAARLGWIAAAVAVLTKGPVGIVLPMLVLAAVLLAEGRLARLRRLADPLAVALFSLVTVVWYGAAAAKGGQTFVARQLLHENLQRFVGRGGHAGHAHPFYYYVPTLAVAFLPWTMVLPAVRGLLREDARARRLLIWILTVFVFYSLSAGKRAAYLLPLFPPLALLVGIGLARSMEYPPARGIRTALLGAAGACLGVAGAIGIWREQCVAALVALLGRERGPEIAAVEAWVRAMPGVFALTFLATALLLRATAIPRCRVWAIGGLAVVLIGATGILVTAPVAGDLTPAPFARAARTAVGHQRVCSRAGLDFPLRYYFGRRLPICPPPTAGTAALPPFIIAAEGTVAPPGYQTVVADPRSAAGVRLTLLAREGGAGLDAESPQTR